jgi:hypothetical protein
MLFGLLTDFVSSEILLHLLCTSKSFYIPLGPPMRSTHLTNMFDRSMRSTVVAERAFLVTSLSLPLVVDATCSCQHRKSSICNSSFTTAWSVGMAGKVFEPPARVVEGAHVQSLEQYKALYQRSVQDPVIHWIKSPFFSFDVVLYFYHYYYYYYCSIVFIIIVQGI